MEGEVHSQVMVKGDMSEQNRKPPTRGKSKRTRK